MAKQKKINRDEMQEAIYREIVKSPLRTVDMNHLTRKLEASKSSIHYGLRALREAGRIESWATQNQGVKGNKAVYVVAGTPMDGYTKIQQTWNHSRGEDFAVAVVPYNPPKPKVFIKNKAIGKRTINGTIFDPKDYGPQDATPVTNDSHHRQLMDELSAGYPPDAMPANVEPGQGIPLKLRMAGKQMGSLV